jgi:SPP1 family predicted phage head-tail adaptor
MLGSRINIGDRDKVIIILSPIVATGVNRPSTNEDEIIGWTELAEVWAKLTPFKGNEAMIAERLTGTHNMIANINYPTDLKGTMRFALMEGSVYDIVSVTPTEDRNRSIDLVGQLNDKEVWT